MRIGLISQWYDPEVGSAGVPGSIAQALIGRGHEVDVLTGFPNYPDGNVYAGYRIRPYLRERRDGVRVHRAPLYPSHDSRPGHRAANFLSLAASSSIVGLKALAEVEATLVYSSPATMAIPAMTLRAVRRTPYVLLIQDMWPQSVTASQFIRSRASEIVERALHRFCDVTYGRAASIAVTSPGMADLLLARGVSPAKISVVPNWADERYFYPTDAPEDVIAEVRASDRFTVMYAGNLGEVQGLEVIIEAATLLRNREEIGFVLVGGGVAEASLRQMTAERGLTNVRFAGPRPVDRMAKVLAAADLQLVTLRDLPIFRSVLPSKVQATLAAGRPLVAAVTGDAASVVRESGAGIVTPPGDAEAMADAVLSASQLSSAELSRRGAAGRSYYMKHLGREAGAEALSSLLQQAAAGAAKR
ncbi:glycosyltransferase family 4 protein [Blastococcus sp. BMG 814]|uniref:Glycosyltransferase family 4 protein n=1 Tax=Blastococcus carthaginiensis TaxID=3050034 RepID=A0ABT9IE63_9ACTN|nr:glycosyltransferase family 4 protein [Blastococcus carthaginiensis]MDP5183843.1 glycosyltransferase family 4 protein [Blastococcus carthaginiensis]